MRPDLGSATSVLEFCLKRIESQGSNYKRKFIQEVTEVGEMSCRGSGLSKHVTEAKEGALEP